MNNKSNPKYYQNQYNKKYINKYPHNTQNQYNDQYNDQYNVHHDTQNQLNNNQHKTQNHYNNNQHNTQQNNQYNNNQHNKQNQYNVQHNKQQNKYQSNKYTQNDNKIPASRELSLGGPNAPYMQNNYDDKIKRNITIGNEIEIKYKNELLDYLYLSVDIYQLRYCILKTTEHAQQLKQQIYNITPHFHGYNYFLIFKKLSDGIIGVYLVYRMDLKFNREDININNIKIYKLDISEFDNLPPPLAGNIESYNNTIFDGKLVFKMEQKIFLFNDILYYKNIKYLTHKLEDKLKFIDGILYELNELLHINFELKIICIYKYSDMSDLVYNKIRNSNFKINGLVFLPNRSGKIFIYVNDSEIETIKNSPNLEIIKNVTNIKIPLNCNLQKRELLLQKTQMVDVYEVFNLDKTIRFGICAIPNMELSFKLRLFVLNTNSLP